MSSETEFLADMASVLVRKAGFAPNSPDVQRLLYMAGQPSMTERLEHMARAAEDLAEECSKRSTILLRMKESGHVDMARIALIFHGLASILRASGDPSQTLREEDFQ